MDGTEYAAQLAQFSSLEQLSNINTSITDSINANYVLTQSINNTMTAALINKEVKLGGSGISYSGQENINLGYNLGSEASTAELKIFDSNGKLVKTITDIEKDRGDHKLTWDFTDNDGSKVAAGEYTFEVTAKATNGNDITVNLFKYGYIDAIRFTEDGTKLMINNTEYLLSDVTEITGNEEEGGN
jgi:flagellar basal-body rod modification protein FlgD